MQFLGGPPGTAVAVLPQVLDYQADVLEMADARVWMQERVRMPEPEALRMSPDQLCRALNQLWRGGSGRRHFVQFIGRGSHADTLPQLERQLVDSLA